MTLRWGKYEQRLCTVSLLVLSYAGVVIWALAGYFSHTLWAFGFKFFEAPAWSIAAVLFFCIAPVPALPVDSKRPSALTYLLLYVTVYIPSLVIPLFMFDAPRSTLITIDAIVAVSFLVTGTAFRLQGLFRGFTGVSERSFLIFAGLPTVLTFAFLIHSMGWPHHFVNPNDVYSVRSKYVEAMSVAPRFLPYLVVWQINVFDPVLIVWGLESRKYLVALMAAVAQILLYSLSGYKSPMVIMASLPILWGVVRIQPTPRHLAILAFSAFSIPLAIAVDKYFTTFWCTTLTIRRMIFAPGQLSAYYFDFFSKHGFTYLSEGFLGRWIKYPFDHPIEKLIGITYLNDSQVSPNANYLASSFASLGYVGPLLFGVLLGAYFWAYDSLAARSKSSVPLVMAGVMVVPIANTNLLTCMFTHGLAPLLLTIALLPSSKDSL